MAGKSKILYLSRISRLAVHDAVFSGIARYAAMRGWTAESVNYTLSHERSLSAIFAEKRPVGCVVECSNGPPDLPPAAFGRMPVVFMNCISGSRGRRIARVAVDNATVAAAAFRELSDGIPDGFAAVGLAGPSMPDSDWSWSHARVLAFRALCRTARKRCRCLENRARGSGLPDVLLGKWIAALPPRTAVFAVNDATAAAVAAAAKAAGRSIPHDLTLIGVDNDAALCEAASPPISSIPVDFESGGFLAARVLGDKISRRAAEPQGMRPVLFGPLLVVRRRSTGGRARREPWVLDAVETIRREACDGLTAAALASRVPGSRRLFEIRFREATGHSVLDEIHQVRLEKVQTLLARPDMPISSIADFCGFKSYHVLHRLFKARTGMTMLRWRKQHFG